jgi:subtilase family protein/uncharacterized protein DUF5648
MPTSRSRASGGQEGRGHQSSLPTERELIVIAEPSAGLRATRDGVASAAGLNVSSLAQALSASGAKMRPLFGPSEERLRSAAGARAATGAEADVQTPDLSIYYRVEAPDENLDELAAELRGHEAVRAAYVKPGAEPAVVLKSPAETARERITVPTTRPAPVAGINDMMPRPEDAPPVTPDFSARQGYLGPAPAGIDAQFAWTRPGGSGAGVNIIDIEGEWRFTHEDLTVLQGGLVGGTPPNDLSWRNHGTAVLGEFSGDRNNLGILGICPDANVRGVSIFGLGTAPAIRRAADLLSPGDIILIELHRPGPRATGVGQQGFIAIEWWPDDYDAIRYAIGRGVVVVEAAGNGAEDLDAAVYDAPAAGFPSNWSNPFRRGVRDSGAILVGAGAPPPGTHGRDWGPDRSRLDFSNFGSAVDAQGWGREVTTTGYGDLQSGVSEDSWYSDQFSGTSSASPIVVGALGCVQGAMRTGGGPPLTPAAARNLLRTTGSVQVDGPGRPVTQRIGNRPNLRQALGPAVGLSVPLQRYWNPQVTDHFYTTNWNELGWGNYGWVYEGIQCYVYESQVAGSVPLHRYWNPSIGDHFYTTNWSELGSGAHGWGYEGIQCYVFLQQGKGRNPLYRYWNGSVGDHFYTTNWAELGWGNYGWVFEGIQCYVAAQVQPPVAQGPGAGAETTRPLGNGLMPEQVPPTSMGLAAPGNGGGMPGPSPFMVGTPMAGMPATFASAAGQQGPEAGASSFVAASRTESFKIKEGARPGNVSVTVELNEGRRG